MSLIAVHDPAAKGKPSVERGPSALDKPEAEHAQSTKDKPEAEGVSLTNDKPEDEDKPTIDDIDTAEEENLQRLRAAYLKTRPGWCLRLDVGANPPESLVAFDNAIWDYLANSKVIFDAGQLQRAKKRCLRVWDDRLAPGYCRVDAFRLAARCTLDHDLALEYLERALEECNFAYWVALTYAPEDKTIWVGNERTRLIQREIEERMAQQSTERGV